jgi:hypothetical protein
MRGKKPSWIACWVNEYAPEMIAWEAMIRRADRQSQRVERRPSRCRPARPFGKQDSKAATLISDLDGGTAVPAAGARPCREVGSGHETAV